MKDVLAQVNARCEWALVIPDEGPDVFHTDCGHTESEADSWDMPTICPHCDGSVILRL